MNPIIKYLAKNKVPEDPLVVRRLRARAASFTIIDRQLYKRGFTMPYLKCICPTEAKEVLFEVHAGTCDNCQGTTSFAFKILRQGNYWPTMKEDAKELVRKCDTCQRHGNLIHVPIEQQTAIFRVCPFFQLGMNILGPLPMAKGQKKFLLVSIDYFTKWVHDSKDTKIYWKRKKDFGQMSCPMCYGRITRLHENRPGKHHFRLTFGMEAVVSVEILSETGRMKVKQPDDTGTRGELDLLEEVREKAAIKMMVYKRRVVGYFNWRVNPRIFQSGDLILRDAAATGHSSTKLEPNWEGPYEVIRSLGKEAYSLKDMRGRPLDRPWNAEHIKRYY
ncbi:uncharacterized protein LOC111406613 [Olea europaea var. sylvestris]|uniref:uncharacterized protein LOC111406613 n=1 Tax=Olea europaea var. sylvestris TaxID=158386 RepID=UPI000C1D7261|nr:uncharacterized protein LOC111406613 [Olea europaea var. sylvestris]